MRRLERYALAAKAPVNCQLYTWPACPRSWTRIHIDYERPVNNQYFQWSYGKRSTLIGIVFGLVPNWSVTCTHDGHEHESVLHVSVCDTAIPSTVVGPISQSSVFTDVRRFWRPVTYIFSRLWSMELCWFFTGVLVLLVCNFPLFLPQKWSTLGTL